MSEHNGVLEEVEDRASEELGIGRWDRPAIFRDAADSATDSDLAYWTVLLLSGGIATLGLALNSSAVVIGAMLIAPLLSPVVGLALALAVGDGRLALQTAAAVLTSTIAVIAVGALLTLALPYQELTSEIASRTRPTTLDLVIAVFSGLAGVVVTVARGHRLSAAIPGVAISVALIPPLAVTGFGVGIGMDGHLIRGSLLLYGANLAGIVLSGMLVFMLVGMHREEVLESVREWHAQEKPTGLVARLDRIAWVRTLGLIRSTWARVGLVVAFVVALAIPLRRTLIEITREVRVRSAVNGSVEALFQVPGRSSVLSQQLVHADGETQVFLRVATTEWYGDEARQNFMRRASTAADEPVRLVLEQLPASSGDIAQLAELIPTSTPTPAVPPPPPQPTAVPALLASLRQRMDQAIGSLTLPDGVEPVGVAVAINGGAGGSLRLAYLAASPLPPEAEQILARQLARAVDDPALGVGLLHLSPQPRPAEAALDDVTDALVRFPALAVQVAASDSAAADTLVRRLTGAGVPSDRIQAAAGQEGVATLRLFRPAPADPPAAADSAVQANDPGAGRPPR